MGPAGESCSGCYFLDAVHDEENFVGWCRRFPPNVLPLEDHCGRIQNIWVSANDWCGEFKPLKPEGTEQ